jgi:hypothetical protein
VPEVLLRVPEDRHDPAARLLDVEARERAVVRRRDVERERAVASRLEQTELEEVRLRVRRVQARHRVALSGGPLCHCEVER